MPRDNDAVSTSEHPWAANMEQREKALRGYAMPGRGRARRRDAARLGFANSFEGMIQVSKKLRLHSGSLE